jgi:hypothetical protein
MHAFTNADQPPLSDPEGPSISQEDIGKILDILYSTNDILYTLPREDDPSISQEDIGKMLDILSSKKDIYMSPREDEVLLEPNPLGPNGLENIKQEVFITTNNWHKDRMFGKILCPLLAGSTLAEDGNKSVEEENHSKNMSLRRVKGRHLSFQKVGGSRLLNVYIDKHGPEDSLLGSSPHAKRFQGYQTNQWSQRFQELKDFLHQSGHCSVPHNYPANQQLAEWVRRQRHQYKLKKMGRCSTSTEAREAALEEIGFVWDSHNATWVERFKSLKEFKAKHGHCSVPSRYSDRHSRSGSRASDVNTNCVPREGDRRWWSNGSES